MAFNFRRVPAFALTRYQAASLSLLFLLLPNLLIALLFAWLRRILRLFVYTFGDVGQVGSSRQIIRLLQILVVRNTTYALVIAFVGLKSSEGAFWTFFLEIQISVAADIILA